MLILIIIMKARCWVHTYTNEIVKYLISYYLSFHRFLSNWNCLRSFIASCGASARLVPSAAEDCIDSLSSDHKIKRIYETKRTFYIFFDEIHYNLIFIKVNTHLVVWSKDNSLSSINCPTIYWLFPCQYLNECRF